MAGQALLQRMQLLGEAAKQWQLFANRHVFGKGLLQARQQPVDRGGAGAWLAWMQFGPVIAAQVLQQAQASLQPSEGFALEQAPCEPGCSTQVLGQRSEQHFAAFADLLPVDAGGLM